MSGRFRCTECDAVIVLPDGPREEHIPCSTCGASDAVRNGIPDASPKEAQDHAVARLEDASLVLLAFAYLIGFLSIVAGLAPFVVTRLALEWKILSAILGTLAGAVLFMTFKYAAEAMRFLASLGRTAHRIEERLESREQRDASSPEKTPDAA